MIPLRLWKSRQPSLLLAVSACAPALFVFIFLFRLQTLPAQAALQPELRAAAGQLPAGSLISSDVTTNTTWTLAASPYSLTRVIQVKAGVSLTVGQGVQVISAQNSGLEV